jgi:hypothetical protein
MLKGRRLTGCGRNTFLIFGFLIVLTSLFMPYKKEAYVTADSLASEIPEKYGDPGEGTIGVLETKPLDDRGVKFFPFFISDAIRHREFLKWKDQTTQEGERIRANKETLEREDIYYLEREFYKKYNGMFEYNNFWLEFYLTEILIILFIAGFSYILFCVVLKKKKKTIRYRKSRSSK